MCVRFGLFGYYDMQENIFQNVFNPIVMRSTVEVNLIDL